MKKPKNGTTDNRDAFWGTYRDDTQPDVALVLEVFGITSFDPRDVQVNTKRSSTVGGGTSVYLTAADVKRLRRALGK